MALSQRPRSLSTSNPPFDRTLSEILPCLGSLPPLGIIAAFGDRSVHPVAGIIEELGNLVKLPQPDRLSLSRLRHLQNDPLMVSGCSARDGDVDSPAVRPTCRQ